MVYSSTRMIFFQKEVLLFFLVQSLSAHALQDCFEHFTHGKVTVTPVLYSMSALTSHECICMCSNREYSYAGIEQGNICLCGNSVNESLAGSGTCDVACPTDLGSVCGGHGSVTIYDAPTKVENYTIDHTGTLFAFEEANLTLITAEGTLASHDINFGDGSFALLSETNSTTHAFHAVGKKILVESNGTDYLTKNISAVSVFEVKARPRNVNFVHCPDVIARLDSFTCEVHIDSGSCMHLHVYLGDGSYRYVNLPESIITHVGQAWERIISTTDSSTNTVILMPNRVFKYHGVIRGWEFNVKTTGDLIYQVYRPVCTYDFCLRSYSCLPWGKKCDKNETNFWKIQCTPPNKPSLSGQRCTNSDEYQFIPSEWTDHPISSFRFVGENTFTASETGFQRMTVSTEDAIRVRPGDIMAVVQERGKLQLTDMPANYEFSSPKGGDWSNRLDSNHEYVNPGSWSSHLFDHHLRATVERTIITKFEHIYDVVQVLNMTAIVNSTCAPDVEEGRFEIDVKQGVENFTVAANPEGITDTVQQFYIPDHAGSAVSYNWTFDDGSELLMSEDKLVNHSFAKPAVYYVECIAYNEVSSQTYEVVVIIQNVVENCTVTPELQATIYGQPTHVQISIVNGTNMTYSIELGDGNFFEIYEMLGAGQFLGATFNYTNVTTDAMKLYNTSMSALLSATADATNFTADFWYIYANIGNYSMTVNCSNFVSWMVVYETFLPVQIPLQNLTIIQPDPIPFHDWTIVNTTVDTGSAVEFTSEFDQNITRIFDMSEITQKGYMILEEFDYLVTGPHNLTLTASNLVPPFTLYDAVTVWVDYLLTDVDIVLNTSYVRPYEAVLFNVTMSNGSRFDATLDYDHDNQSDHEYRYEMLTGDLIVFEHVFVDIDFYDVNLTIVNPVGNVTLIRMVTVQHPVLEMVLTTENIMPIYPASLCDVPFNITFTPGLPISQNVTTTALPVPLPTDAFHIYTFGDADINPNPQQSILNQSLPMVYEGNMLVAPHTDVHSYHQFGTYNVSLNISNFVSHMFFHEIVIVEEPALDLTVVANPLYVSINTNSTILVTMSWGSRIEIMWNFTDGTPVVYAPYNPNDTDSNYQVHQFDVVGVFPLLIRTVNYLGETYTELGEPVIVQKPVLNFTVTGSKSVSLMSAPDWFVFIEFDLWRITEFDMPTNTSFIVNFGDGTITEPALLPDGDPYDCTNQTFCNPVQHVMQFNHTYFKGKDYSVDVTIWNLVSNLTFTYRHDIYEKITGLEKLVYHSENVSQLSGFGDQGDYYPLENDILFESSLERGSLITFTWDYGDGIMESIYNEPSISHKYTNPGTYIVTLNATNKLSTSVITKTIHIQRSVSDIGLYAFSPQPRNMSLSFKLSPGTIGTDTCYYIDFKDVNSDGGKDLFLGNHAQCVETYGNKVTPESKFNPYTAEEFEAIQLTSPLHLPNITIYNMFQDVGIYDLLLEVTNKVSSANFVLNFGVTRGPCTYPSVDIQGPNACAPNSPFCDSENHKTHYKSVLLQVKSQVKIDCKSTKIAHYNWTIYTVNEYTYEEIEYTGDIGDTELYNAPLPSVKISKKLLPYGLYKFQLNVSMDGEIGIYTVDQAYIRIIKTPIVTSILGGPRKRLQWGTKQEFDAGFNTYDPDVDQTDSSGFTYTWLCRRLCETFPTYNTDYTEEQVPFTTECTDYYEADVGGCFKTDNINSSGLVQNNTESLFQADFYDAYENDIIVLMVVVTKDTRTVTYEQTVEITPGAPPVIFINCKSNCRTKNNQFKLNPDMKLSLETSVQGARRGTVYIYEWTLHVSEKDQNFESAELVKYEAWSHKCSENCNLKANLAIKPGLFQIQDATKKFYFTVRVYRRGSDPSNYGETQHITFVNTPPLPGNCSITPNNGTALETKYNVECQSLFLDEDEPMKYSIGFKRCACEEYSWVYNEGDNVTMPEGIILPQGDPANGNWLMVGVIAVDYIGSAVGIEIGTTVFPPEASTMTSLMDSISDGAMLDNMVASGDVGSTCTVLGAISSTFNMEPDNSEPQGNSSANGTVVLTGEAKTKARESFGATLAQLQPASVGEITVIASSAQQVSTNRDEMTVDCQVALTSATTTGINSLANVMEEVSMEASETESAATSLLGPLGNVLDSVSQTPGDVITSTTSDGTARRKREVQKQMEDETRDNLLDQSGKLGGFVNDQKVPGEGQSVLSTPNLELTCDKQFTDDFMGGSLDGQNGNELVMPVDNTLFGEGNETAQSVAAKVIRMARNPFKQETSNETLDIDSNIVMLSLGDDSGGAIEAESTADPAHIIITRDPSVVKMDYVVNRTYDDDDVMIIHKLIVPGNSSLHVHVIQTWPTNVTNETTWNDTSTTGYNGTTANDGNYTWTTTPDGETTVSFMTTNSPTVFTTTAPGTTSTAAPTTTQSPTTTTEYMPASSSPFTTMSPLHRNVSVSSMNITNPIWANWTTTTASPTTTQATTTTEAPTTTTTATSSLSDLFNIDNRTRFTVYVGIDMVPSVTRSTFNCTIPMIIEEDSASTESPTTTQSSENGTDSETTAPKQPVGAKGYPDIDTCFWSNIQVDKLESTTVYVGIKSEKPNITDDAATTQSPLTTTATNSNNDTEATTVAPGRRRRSAGNDTFTTDSWNNTMTTEMPTEEPFDPFAGPVYYQLVVYAAQCKYYSPYTQLWETAGCEVGPLTTPYKTHCICNLLTPPKPEGYVTTTTPKPYEAGTTMDPNLVPPPPQPKPTSFGASFAVPVNTINPADSAFLKLDSNPVIFSTMVSLMCLYLVLIIWAKKADQIDELKAGSSPLFDNDPRHQYLYELTVYTGSKARAGTTAKVSMMFSGDEDETDPRLIFDDKRPVLQKGGVDSFIMAVPRCLGQLSHLRVWHDNSGKNPSWLFSRLAVRDLQTGQKYYFISNKWLAIEEEDGLIDRMIPLAGRDELTNFNHLFWTKTKKDLTDGHIWFSVFGRPAKSSFTRCQRLTCCISLLFCTMMANILFYDTDDGSAPQQEIVIGPISMTPQSILTGIYSSLIVFPVNLCIVMMFRYARPSKKKCNDPKKSKPEFHDMNQPVDAKDELEQQIEYLKTGNINKHLLMESRPGTSASLARPATAQALTDPDEKMTARSGKKKKKFMLPNFFIYIAYFLSLISCGAAFYVTVEIGGVFGAKKSNEWMVSFAVSIIESVFFTQPIKVLGLAVFYSLVIKKPDQEEEEDIDDLRDPALKQGEEFLHTHHKKADKKWKKAMASMKNIPLPPDEEYLKACRELRFKEMKMQAVLMEILVYLLFLYLLMMVAYGNRDPWSNTYYRSVEDLVAKGVYSSSAYEFQSVNNFKTFFTWANNTFIDGIYPDLWYNGNDYWFSKGFAKDRNSYMIGVPRFRQLRMPNTKCDDIPISMGAENCRKYYDITEEDEGEYKENWAFVNYTDPEDAAVENWIWKNGDELDGYPTSGRLGFYGGGGFVAELGKTREEAAEKVNYLYENNWLDTHTRVVFAEFAIYNPHLNLHGISFLAFEFLPTGACYPYYKFHVMRLDRYVGTYMLTIMAAELLVAVFTIYNLVREIKKIKKEKKQYFKDFWNVIEFSITGLLIGAIVMYFYRLILSLQVQSNYRDNPNKFINFQWPAGWDELYVYLFAMIVFASTLKFLKLLRFNKKMSMLGLTLAMCAKPIASFLVVFGVVFFAFAQASFLIFGRVLVDFSTFITAAETLFSMMLNKFDFNSLIIANPFFAPIMFLSFTVFVSFMLLSFFLTLIIDAFSVVKWELKRKENEYEIVDFMVGRLKSFFGIGNGGRVPALGQEGLDGFVSDNTGEMTLKIEGMLEWFSDYYSIDEQSEEPEVKKLLDKMTQKNKKPLKIYSAN